MREARLEVGRVAKAHGLRGEVVVDLTTDRTERLDPGSVLDTDRGPLTVVHAARHQRRWRVAFDGIGTREEAEQLRGLVLRAEPIDDPDVWFIHDLIGKPIVESTGDPVGTCTAIVENPAHDLLEVDDRLLIPMPFVTAVDDDRIVVDLPEGLLEVADGRTGPTG